MAETDLLAHAIDLERRGQGKAAARIFGRLAEAGNAEAAAYLGNSINWRGDPEIDGVPADAAYWYKKAAKGGSFRGALFYALELDDPEDGDLAEATRWYEIARPELEREAEAGNAASLLLLSNMHALGWGVPENEVKGVALLEKAASLGDLEAMFRLAGHYWHLPDRTEKQRLEAIRLWRHAADHGVIDAQYELGVYYATDADMPIDAAESMRYYAMAAENGSLEALYNMGAMHLYGEGTRKDEARGAALIVGTAEWGEQSAQLHLSRAYTRGLHGFPVDPEQAAYWQHRYDDGRDPDGINDSAPPAPASRTDILAHALGLERRGQLASAMRIAASLAGSGDVEAAASLGRWIALFGDPKIPGVSSDAAYWLRKSAEGGSARGAMLYAMELDRDEGDRAEAARWYKVGKEALEREAEAGNTASLRLLSDAYFGGWGVAQDDARSIALLRQAADLGDLDAMFYLGERLWRLYERKRNEGHPVPVEAIQLLRRAADHGSIDAQYYLGVLYATDKDAPIDYAESLRYYGMAAENGDMEALYNMGTMHLDGEGTPKDEARGTAMIIQAAKGGDIIALDYLAKAYTHGYHGAPVDPEEAAYWQRLYEAEMLRD